MARKSRFTAEQRKWWQNELTKYYQRMNGNKDVGQSDKLFCCIDEWVTNYETNVVDLKAKIIEGFGPKS